MSTSAHTCLPDPLAERAVRVDQRLQHRPVDAAGHLVVDGLRDAEGVGEPGRAVAPRDHATAPVHPSDQRTLPVLAELAERLVDTAGRHDEHVDVVERAHDLVRVHLGERQRPLPAEEPPRVPDRLVGGEVTRQVEDRHARERARQGGPRRLGHRRHEVGVGIEPLPRHRRVEVVGERQAPRAHAVRGVRRVERVLVHRGLDEPLLRLGHRDPVGRPRAAVPRRGASSKRPQVGHAQRRRSGDRPARPSPGAGARSIAISRCFDGSSAMK